ncbi:MAG: hypothetical protein M1399_09625 [Actinobacteria bacterium]|nr:hypothetical protein [Actinomycetota bacterium]MCL5447376.1 hypothetical protein [Actinomycetota bacterium]
MNIRNIPKRVATVSRYLRFGVLLSAGALALAACSSSTSTPSAPKSTNTYPAGSSSSTTSGTSSTATAHSQLSTAHTSIGTVLVNGSGQVLYTLTSASATSSPCDTSKCLGIWPPLLGSSGLSAGTGISSAHIGTLTLPSGAKQVTYYGHPLYTFSGDTAAGQVKGEGLAFPIGVPNPSGHWYAISATGSMVVKTASTSTPSSSSSSGGSSYGGSSGAGYSSGPKTGSSTAGHSSSGSSSGGWNG